MTMNTTIRYSAFLFCSLICLTTQANDVLEKHLKAIGGRERIAGIETIYRAGTVTGDGGLGEVTGTFEESANLVGLFGYDSIELLLGGHPYLRKTGWSRESAWKNDSQSGFGNLLPEEANFIAYQYSPSPLATIVLTDASAEVEELGEAEFGGAECDVLSVSGRSERFYINRESHLLQGISIPGLMNLKLSEYEIVDGVQIPSKRVIEITILGVTLDYRFDKTQLNRAIDPKQLEKPKRGILPNRSLPPHHKKRLRTKEVIDQMDANSDKNIDLEEFIIANSSEPSGEVLKRFKTLDVNGDDVIDVFEADAVLKYATRRSGRYANDGAGIVTAQQLVEAMDKNGDGKITNAEAVEDVKVAFEDLDTNSDGVIDVAEAEVMAKYANQQAENTLGQDSKDAANPKGVTAQQLIRYMDTNGDNMISKDEANEQLKPNFGYIDANGDGLLDLQETQKIADYMNSP